MIKLIILKLNRDNLMNQAPDFFIGLKIKTMELFMVMQHVNALQPKKFMKKNIPGYLGQILVMFVYVNVLIIVLILIVIQ